MESKDHLVICARASECKCKPGECWHAKPHVVTDRCKQEGICLSFPLIQPCITYKPAENLQPRTSDK